MLIQRTGLSEELGIERVREWQMLVDDEAYATDGVPHSHQFDRDLPRERLSELVALLDGLWLGRVPVLVQRLEKGLQPSGRSFGLN